MNATFSRQLAQLVQEPPAGLDPMSVIKIREDLVRATDRRTDEFAGLPDELQDQLRQWPRFTQKQQSGAARCTGTPCAPNVTESWCGEHVPGTGGRYPGVKRQGDK